MFKLMLYCTELNTKLRQHFIICCLNSIIYHYLPFIHLEVIEVTKNNFCSKKLSPKVEAINDFMIESIKC